MLSEVQQAPDTAVYAAVAEVPPPAPHVEPPAPPPPPTQEEGQVKAAGVEVDPRSEIYESG